MASLIGLGGIVIIASLANVLGVSTAERIGSAWSVTGWAAAACWALASASFSYYRTLDDMDLQLKRELRYGGSELIHAALFLVFATGFLGAISLYEASPLFRPRQDVVWFVGSLVVFGLGLLGALAAVRGVAAVFMVAWDVMKIDKQELE